VLVAEFLGEAESNTEFEQVFERGQKADGGWPRVTLEGIDEYLAVGLPNREAHGGFHV
jgi:hypothetical protein